MADVAPDSDGAPEAARMNGVFEVGPDTVQLMSSIAALPAAERLALRAYQQMQLACSARNREYPKTNSPALSAQESSDIAEASDDLTSELLRLIANGTKDQNETRKLGLLALVGILQHWPESDETFSKLVQDLFWLECESRLPILTLLAQVLDSSRKSQLSTALHHIATVTDSPYRCDRCLALVWAQALRGDLGCQTTVLELSRLATHAPSGEGSSTRPQSWKEAIHGRVLSAPRGLVATAIAIFSGWMLVRYLFASLGKFILGYRARAQVIVTERGIEIHEQTTILGRKLRDTTRVVALQAVRSLSREVRYARGGMYAGLAALALGSFVGMRLFVDGVRAPGFSSPTVLMGLLVILAGIGLDFACTNWLEVSRSQCRLLIETVRGRGLYLTCDDPGRVNSVLLDLATKLTT